MSNQKMSYISGNAMFWIAIFSFCYTLVHSMPSTPSLSDSGTEDPVDPSEYYGNLSPEIIRKIQKCDRDMDTMELCMRCAKVTKSQIVYPMCCDNEDNVKHWCHDYIYFGTRK